MLFGSALLQIGWLALDTGGKLLFLYLGVIPEFKHS